MLIDLFLLCIIIIYTYAQIKRFGYSLCLNVDIVFQSDFNFYVEFVVIRVNVYIFLSRFYIHLKQRRLHINFTLIPIPFEYVLNDTLPNYTLPKVIQG